MSGLTQKLLSGSFWALVGRFLMMLLAMALNMILARILSPEDLGVYFISLAVVVTIATIGQLGMNHVVVRLVAEGMSQGFPAKARAAVFFALKVAATGTFVLSLLVFFGPGEWLARDVFNSPPMATIVGLLVVWIFGRSFQDVLAESFRGFHSIGMSVFFGGLLTTGLSVLFCLVLYWFYGEVDLGLAIRFVVISFFVNALFGLFLLVRLVPVEKQVGSLDQAATLHIAMPLWGSSLISMLLIQLDMWVMGMTSNAADVALYGAALKLVALVDIPLMIVTAVVPPVIAEMYAKGDLKELEKILRVMASLAMLPVIALVLIFLFFGSPVLGLLYGEKYSEASGILLILSVGHMVFVWGGACGYALSMTGNQKYLFRIMVMTLVAALLASYPMAKMYGAIGVACVTSGWLIVLHVWALLEVRARLGIWTHAHWNPVVVFNILKSGLRLRSKIS